jgi:hypothetical protein
MRREGATMSTVTYRDPMPLDGPCCAVCGSLLFESEKAQRGAKKVPGYFCKRCIAANPEVLEGVAWAKALASEESSRRQKAKRVFKYAAEEGVPVEATTRGAITETDAGLAYVWAERTV